MYKGFKVKIYPNKEQQTKLFQFFGAAKFAYNWTIAKEEENYNKNLKYSQDTYEMEKKNLKIIIIQVLSN